MLLLLLQNIVLFHQKCLSRNTLTNIRSKESMAANYYQYHCKIELGSWADMDDGCFQYSISDINSAENLHNLIYRSVLHNVL